MEERGTDYCEHAGALAEPKKHSVMQIKNI